MRKKSKLSSTVWCSKRIFIILVLIFIFLVINYYLNFSNLIKRTHELHDKAQYNESHDKVQYTHKDVLKDLTCQKLPETVLQMVDEDYSPPNRTIFFLETSCKGGLNSREACAVESAARQHPDRLVTVLFTGPLNTNFVKGKIFAKLSLVTNMELRRINVTDFVKGTPLEGLFSGDKIIKSLHPVVHSSDILRILTLFKYGGLYLDLDFVVMKSFNSLPNNFVSRESISSVSNGILAFSTDEISKHFLEVAVNDLAKSYNPQSWAGNGPDLILRTLRKVCDVQGLANMTHSSCNGIHILDSKLFYPIYYTAWRQYFNDILPEASDAYTHHIWNALGHDTTVPKISLYARLAHTYCAGVYEIFGDFFGI